MFFCKNPENHFPFREVPSAITFQPSCSSGTRAVECEKLIFLLLRSLYICYIVRVLQPGAASAGGAASVKGLPAGETRNGLQPCGLWPIVWVPVTAAP